MTKGSRRSGFPPDTIPWDELAFQSTTDALREFLGGSAKDRPLRTGAKTRLYAIVISFVR